MVSIKQDGLLKGVKMREKNTQQIQEIMDHFSKLGYSCQDEVKTIYNSNSNNNAILNGKLNKIDTCCQKGKDVRCFEVEDSQFNQCLKNRRALEEAKKEWQKKGLNVSWCQMGANEDFKKICPNVKESGFKKSF